jgi:hypothetical protein
LDILIWLGVMGLDRSAAIHARLIAARSSKPHGFATAARPNVVR